MLIFKNAQRPALRSTNSPSMTIARRDRQNVSKARNVVYLPEYARSWCAPRSSAGRCSSDVAHEQRPLGGDEFSGLHALKDLHEPVLLKADLDRPLDQAFAVGG